MNSDELRIINIFSELDISLIFWMRAALTYHINYFYSNHPDDRGFVGSSIHKKS